MKVSYSWLQTYFDKPLPEPEELIERLSLQAFEVEGVETTDHDVVIDIDVLPNRAHDCLSHNGIAREIGALFNLAVRPPNMEVEVDEVLKSADYLSLTVLEPKLVIRATKRLVMDVKVEESPEWLRNRLEAIGQKSINNIVDSTNYITFETNQPVHAFDFDKLVGADKKNIFIRRASRGEKITTLDGGKYTLDNNMLVIADDKKALDIAGVKGGANSGIDENTTKIVLSVCNFDSVNIRRTSKALGLQTDASKRFENGITPELVSQAMNRLSVLVREVAGGRIAEDYLDLYPKNFTRTAASYKIGVSLNEVNEILGTQLTKAKVEQVLSRLSFSYELIKPRERITELVQTLVGIPYKYGPSVTFDSPRVFDCGSLTNYVHVMAGIAIPRMVQDQFVFGEEVKEKDLLPGDMVFASTNSDGNKEPIERLGITQVRHTLESVDFVPGVKLERSVDHSGIYLGEGKVVHASPKWDKGKVVIEQLSDSRAFEETVGFRRQLLSEDERFVVEVPFERLDLRAGNGFLVSGNKEDLVEEIGRVYGYDKIKPQLLKKDLEPKINKEYYYANKIRDVLVGLGFSDVCTYSLGEEGEIELENSLANDKSKMRTSLHGGITDVMTRGDKYKDLLGLDVVKVFEVGRVFDKKGEYTHVALGVLGGGIEGVVEKLSETLGVDIKAKHDDNIAEFSLTKILDNLPDPTSYSDLNREVYDISYTPISQYPFVLRDIAVWVPESVSRDELVSVISRTAGELLVMVTFFDEYNKDNETSYAHRLVFQSQEKTLSDVEVNEIMKSVEEVVAKKGWKVR